MFKSNVPVMLTMNAKGIIYRLNRNKYTTERGAKHQLTGQETDESTLTGSFALFPDIFHLVLSQLALIFRTLRLKNL